VDPDAANDVRVALDIAWPETLAKAPLAGQHPIAILGGARITGRSAARQQPAPWTAAEHKVGDMRGLQRTDHRLFVTVCHRQLPAANRETNHRIERSCSGVGPGRAFGPPIGFRRLPAVAEFSDVGAPACV